MSFKKKKPKSAADLARQEERLVEWRALAQKGQSTITAVTAAGVSGTRADVFVDNELVGRLNIDQVLAFGLARDVPWTPDLAEKVLVAAAETEVLDKAMRILEFNTRSRAILKDKLIRECQFEPLLVEKALDRLEVTGILNDTGYAAQITQSGHSRGWGRRRVESELFKRKIPREIVSQAMSDLSEEDGGEEEETAFLQAEKRWARLAGMDVSTKRQRIYSYLARRGFAPGTISLVLGRLGQEAVEEMGDEWPEGM